MNDDLDGLITRLARQPLPGLLDQLEAAVARSIKERAASVPMNSWRFAATGLALALGVGVGSSAASMRDQPVLTAELTAGGRLAPSSLLETSQ